MTRLHLYVPVVSTDEVGERAKLQSDDLVARHDAYNQNKAPWPSHCVCISLVLVLQKGAIARHAAYSQSVSRSLVTALLSWSELRIALAQAGDKAGSRTSRAEL